MPGTPLKRARQMELRAADNSITGDYALNQINGRFDELGRLPFWGLHHCAKQMGILLKGVKRADIEIIWKAALFASRHKGTKGEAHVLRRERQELKEYIQGLLAEEKAARNARWAAEEAAGRFDGSKSAGKTGKTTIADGEQGKDDGVPALP